MKIPIVVAPNRGFSLKYSNKMYAQLHIFIWCFVSGLCLAFSYDLFRIKQIWFRSKKTTLVVEDVIYWLFIAIVLFYMIYYLNNGEIRDFIFLGLLLGALLYIIFFSKFVLHFASMLYNIFYYFFKRFFMTCCTGFSNFKKIFIK